MLKIWVWKITNIEHFLQGMKVFPVIYVSVLERHRLDDLKSIYYELFQKLQA